MESTKSQWLLKLGKQDWVLFPKLRWTLRPSEKQAATERIPLPKLTSPSGAAMTWHRTSIYKDCCHRWCWGKRRTKGRKLQCLQTAGQFRTKLKIICSDINQGSLQTGGSQAELGLQKGSVQSTLGLIQQLHLKGECVSTKQKSGNFIQKFLNCPISEKYQKIWPSWVHFPMW